MIRRKCVLLFLMVFCAPEIIQADVQGFGSRGFGIGVGHRYNRYRGFARGGVGVHIGTTRLEPDDSYRRRYYKYNWRPTWPNDPEQKYQNQDNNSVGETYRIDRLKVGSSTMGK